MNLLETDALVIRHMNWSESSKIVTFYTKQHGLIKLIARSAQKKNNKFLGVLEVCQFLTIHYDYKPQRQLNYLKEADILLDNHDLIKQPNAYYGLLTIMEILDKTLHVNDSQPELYDEIYQIRQVIDKGPNSKYILLAFLLKYFDIMGYRLDLHRCSNCGNDDLKQIQFDLKIGLRCQDCLLHHIENEFSPEMYQLLNYVEETELHVYKSEMKDFLLFKMTMNILLKYLSYHVDRNIEINALSFIT
jgi:DNA repair protein RecO (recombination protein O)